MVFLFLPSPTHPSLVSIKHQVLSLKNINQVILVLSKLSRVSPSVSKEKPISWDYLPDVVPITAFFFISYSFPPVLSTTVAFLLLLEHSSLENTLVWSVYISCFLHQEESSLFILIAHSFNLCPFPSLRNIPSAFSPPYMRVPVCLIPANNGYFVLFYLC